MSGQPARRTRQGPWARGRPTLPRCAAGAKWGGPRACSSAGRAGLGPFAQDGKCPLTVASLLWGLVSRAYC